MDICCPGGGATQIIMPYLTIALGHKRPLFQAWRIAFFFPAIAHIVMAVLILFFGQVTSSNLITYCFL